MACSIPANKSGQRSRLVRHKPRVHGDWARTIKNVKKTCAIKDSKHHSSLNDCVLMEDRKHAKTSRSEPGAHHNVRHTLSKMAPCDDCVRSPFKSSTKLWWEMPSTRNMSGSTRREIITMFGRPWIQNSCTKKA